MQQRTALEQDVIDFAKSIEEIYEKQLELQKELMELFRSMVDRLELSREMDMLTLNQFDVNAQAFKDFNGKEKRQDGFGRNFGSNLSY